ncbi:hypothetical protein ABVK25_009200 [Lepraria finkii]|uniref:Uncharacterized protein n=1 Tax=Lepraria finkii TaxID=1340010 RepID=A0ABR4AY05_9LECA
MTDVSKEPRTGVDRSISRASNTRPSMNLDSFFSFEKQRVKQDEGDPDAKVNMPEPWNVQDIVISTDGIEVHQFGESYARDHGKPGPRKPEEDEHY